MSTTFTISGNLAADPDLRYTPTGTAVVTFVVISNERHRDTRTGRWVDGRRTDVRVTAWESLAENTAESLHTGSRVTVTGHRIDAYAWIGETDQAAHAVLELTADDVHVGLRRHTLTAQKTTRAATYPDAVAGPAADQAADVLHGPAEPRTEQDGAGVPADLAVPMAELRDQLGAVPVEDPDGGVS